MQLAQSAGVVTRQPLSLLEVSSDHLWLGEHFKPLATDGILHRRAFNPTRIKRPLLPCLIKWKPVIHDGRVSDFEFTVFGQTLVELMGTEMTGRRLSDLPFLACQHYMLALGQLTLNTQKPVYSVTNLSYRDNMTIDTEKSFYPVLESDGWSVLILFTIHKLSFNLNTMTDAGEPLRADDHYCVLRGIGDWVATT